MRKTGKRLNLLELKPCRIVAWEAGEKSLDLVVPRFGPSLQKWLGPLMRRPTFRVRLDDFGAFVWLRCDGVTTVEQIAGQLERHFGPTIEPLYERLERFLRRLEREGFICIA